MFKALIASTLFVGALALPAAADEVDFRIVGGSSYGYQPAGQNGWDDGGDDGYAARPGFERGWRPRGDGRPAYGYERPGADWRLPPRQIIRSLRMRGYYDIDIVRQRPDVAIVRASARGRDMILVVDARSGEVLRQRPADHWRRSGGWHGGWGADWRRW